ncbi:hypothetical protein JMJ35_004956 [Cladonia borealis]|uniref:HPP transmembrane region domain-containing protein n=1 Tax=Cladonia borealis TaxID=184061 RepID=A0AA39V5T2_9LECA|nr:hypothetical protein JMJ35_004956 [Cladonia borealis]
MCSTEAKHFSVDIDRHLNAYIPSNFVHRLPKPIARFLGYRDGPRQDIGNVLIAGWAFLGAFVGIITIEAVFMIPAIHDHGVPIVIASFGAAAILEYNTIESPLAQPRNIIIGHFLSAVIGISVTKLFSLNPNFENLQWVAGALACGLASAAMTLTKTIHPPAGATALLAAVDPQVEPLGWYLLPLVLLSTALMLVTSLLLNNIQRQYPTYWWTPADLARKDKPDDVEKNSSSKMSLNPKMQNAEEAEEPVIKITKDGVSVPDGICFAHEEMDILEVLHQRLGFGMLTLQEAAVQPRSTRASPSHCS